MLEFLFSFPFIILEIIVVIVLILIGISFYLGCCYNMKINSYVLDESIYVYHEFQSNVKNIPINSKKVYKELGQKCIEALDKKICKFMFICFDDPNNLKDCNKLRYCAGLLFPNKDLKDYQLQELSKSRFSTAFLPKSSTIRTSFPYKCFLSFNIGSDKAWPLLIKNAAMKKEMTNIQQKDYIYIEFWNNDSIEYILLTENLNKFDLTTNPKPKMKNE